MEHVGCGPQQQFASCSTDNVKQVSCVFVQCLNPACMRIAETRDEVARGSPFCRGNVYRRGEAVHHWFVVAQCPPAERSGFLTLPGQRACRPWTCFWARRLLRSVMFSTRKNDPKP